MLMHGDFGSFSMLSNDSFLQGADDMVRSGVLGIQMKVARSDGLCPTPMSNASITPFRAKLVAEADLMLFLFHLTLI